MRRVISLLTLVGMLAFASGAFADTVGLPEEAPGQRANVVCKNIGELPAAQVREQVNATPPPEPVVTPADLTDLTGPPLLYTPARGKECPAGTLPRLAHLNLPRSLHMFKERRPNAGGVNGYYYAGYEYEKQPNIGEVGEIMVGNPAVPANPYQDHSLGQIWEEGGVPTTVPQYTIEVGWIKEATDSYPKIFLLENWGYYAEGKTNWGTDYVPTISEQWFEKELAPTDGTPTSACMVNNGTEYVHQEPCRTYLGFAVEQYKGAWWIQGATRTWAGYIPDKVWATAAKPTGAFKSSHEASLGGEVYDPAKPPTSQMGNGQPASSEAATTTHDIGLLQTNKETKKKEWKFHTLNQASPTEIPGPYHARVASSGNFFYYGD